MKVGGALTTAKQVLNGAFLGSAGVTARWLSGKWWPEYAEYLKVMASHREYQNVANIMKQQFEAYGKSRSTINQVTRVLHQQLQNHRQHRHQARGLSHTY